MEPNRVFWGMLSRRQCLVPTRRGWLLLALGVGVLAVAVLRGAYPFLALNDPAPGGILVVEGWVPDYALAAAGAEFRRHPYAKLLVTGIPLEHGAPLSEYKNYAHLGAATLIQLGLSTNDIQAVPAPLTRRDRTYATALSLKAWLREQPVPPTKVNLVTTGPHARRSRLLFEKALGRDFTVGVLSVPGRDFDAQHWWRSSQGVRVVTGEMIAYCYVRFFFRPNE